METSMDIIFSAYDFTSAGVTSAITNVDRYGTAVEQANERVANSAQSSGEKQETSWSGAIIGASLLAAKVAIVGAAVVGAGVLIYKYWEEIKSAFFTTVDTIQTGATSLGGWLADTFGGIVNGAIRFLGEGFNTMTGVIGAAFQGIQDGSITWRTVLEGAMRGVLMGIATVEFAFKNWKEELEAVMLAWTLSVVKAFNIAVHFMTEVIPKTAQWFWENWRDIFATVYDYTSTVFVNLSKNIMDFADEVISWLKGDGFNFEWTGLTEGFESSLKELPKIVEREKGALEQSLESMLGERIGALKEEFQAHLTQRMKDWNDVPRHITDGIAGAADDVGKMFDNMWDKASGFAKDLFGGDLWGSVGNFLKDMLSGSKGHDKTPVFDLASAQTDRFITGASDRAREQGESMLAKKVDNTNSLLKAGFELIKDQLPGFIQKGVEMGINKANRSGIKL